jgi:hypothetical protein
MRVGKVKFIVTNHNAAVCQYCGKTIRYKDTMFVFTFANGEKSHYQCHDMFQYEWSWPRRLWFKIKKMVLENKV